MMRLVAEPLSFVDMFFLSHGEFVREMVPTKEVSQSAEVGSGAPVLCGYVLPQLLRSRRGGGSCEGEVQGEVAPAQVSSGQTGCGGDVRGEDL